MDVGEQPPQTATLDEAEEQTKDSVRHRVERHLWRRMASGFLVLIPLIVTIVILDLVIDFLDGFVRPLPFVHDQPYDIYGIGLVFSLVLLYIIGSMVTGRMGSKALNWQDAVLRRIPVVKNIYGVASQATAALSTPLEHQFSRVVFIEWPRPGVRALGLVTGHVHNPATGGGTVVVYIPTVPNPTSGMLAWVSEDQVTETDITVEDAMKAVFSGGIVLPDIPALGETVELVQIPARLEEGDKSAG